MVISIKKEVMEIAKRKICELSKKNPRFKTYCEHVLMQQKSADKRTISRTANPFVKTAGFGRGNSCTDACVGQSVLEILARRPKLFTFKEAYAILKHCNMNQNRSFVEEIIRRYGIVITGLPKCAKEDLILAVFFFVEDVFGIQPKIEFCTKLIEDEGFHMIGVVFENIVTKQKIAEKLRILQDSGIQIDTDFDIIWIEDHIDYLNSVDSD